jgi:hypothetical protein
MKKKKSPVIERILKSDVEAIILLSQALQK